MNILAVDFGKKRIGLAWADTAMGVVLPYGVVVTVVELAMLIQKERIEKVVIGLPTGLDGKENENTKTVRLFADELKKSLEEPAPTPGAGSRPNVGIEFLDERFTSAEADRMGLRTGGGATRDEKAAMLLLQSYLDKKK